MVQIRIDQSGRPAGVPGVAREDLVLGVPVALTAVGGPYFQYRWSVISKPFDVTTSTRSGAVIVSPSTPSALMTPIDIAGTHFVELAVDSGSGLGALESDIARITFYAGPTLGAPGLLPRRIPAIGETIQHNVGGNQEGWGAEMRFWYQLIVQAIGSASAARIRTFSQTFDFADDFAGLAPGVQTLTKNIGALVPANTRLAGVFVSRAGGFSAPVPATYVLDVGLALAPDTFASGLDVSATAPTDFVAGNGANHIYGLPFATQLQATVTSSVDLNTTNAGSIQVDVLHFVSPSEFGP